MFSHLLVFLFVTVSAFSAQALNFDLSSTLTSNSAVANYYSSSWTDGTAKIKYTNGAGGEYAVTWSGNKGNFVCGKGWSTGGPRTVNFTGTFSPNGNGYLSIYGWTTNPLVEYYITEYYGTHVPYDSPNVTMKANLTSDGSTYQIFTKMRVNKPSIQGTATFPQFWSVRNGGNLTLGSVNGTITTGNHYDAWTKAGFKLGKQSYMIVAVEGQDSNGTAQITVSG